MAPRSDHLLQHIRRLTAGSSASSDAELLQHYIQQRDEDAFAALVQRHGPMVQGVCRRILSHAQDAEDASQATFLVLARKAASVQPPHALAAWLYGVARRVALKARGAKVRHRRVMTAAEMQAVDPCASPLDDLSARELLAIFDEEVERLPRVYRLPLILCCVEGRSQEEAAQQLGWTPGSVKGRLERGRVKLHARLRRRGLTLAAALAVMESARAAAMVRPGVVFTPGQQPTGAAQSLADAVLRRMAWSRAIVWVGVLSAACVCISASVFAL